MSDTIYLNTTPPDEQMSTPGPSHDPVRHIQEQVGCGKNVAWLLNLLHAHDAEGTKRSIDGRIAYVCWKCGSLVGAKTYSYNGSPANLSH